MIALKVWLLAVVYPFFVAKMVAASKIMEIKANCRKETAKWKF